MALLRPDRFVTSILKLDFEELQASGITTALLDLDNTVLPRTTDTVPPKIVAQLDRGKEDGFRFCLLSNNWHQRCHEVARRLGMPIVTHAMKPLPFGFWRACALMGVSKNEVIVVGDQLFTDVLGAHLVHLKVVLVRPLARYDLPHTLFLRKLEKHYMRGLRPET